MMKEPPSLWRTPRPTSFSKRKKNLGIKFSHMKWKHHPTSKPDSRISTLQPRENRTHSRQERRKADERERERERDSLFGIHLARSRPPRTGSVFWSSTPLTTDHDLEDHQTPSKFCYSFSSPPADHGWWCAGFWGPEKSTARKRQKQQ
jgi:hypothetical protein